MRYLQFGMKNLNETQTENNAFSHKNLLAVDYAGKDNTVEGWYCFDGCYKVLAIKPYATTGFSNTMFITPCDKKGKNEKVKCADGIVRYVTIALSHDNKFNYNPGQIVPAGSRIYDEGTAGPATGNHIHCEVGAGIQTAKIKSGGQYKMKDALYPSKMFYLNPKHTKLLSKRTYKKLTVPTVPTDALRMSLGKKMNKTQVKNLQLCLNYVLGTQLVADGDFGKKTDAAVKKFQAMVGLTQNGHYGPKTQAALKEAVI